MFCGTNRGEWRRKSSSRSSRRNNNSGKYFVFILGLLSSCLLSATSFSVSVSAVPSNRSKDLVDDDSRMK